MSNFRYRALTESGEVVTGSISAPSIAEVAHRIEYLGLVPIDTILEEAPASIRRFNLSLFGKPRAEDVTIFTRDLALMLKAGARVNDGLELLSIDMDIGRLRPIVSQIRAAVLAGESFADALSHHPTQFPPIYIALVRVGEASGTLDHILEVLANERARAEALRRKLADALRYPAFVLAAASCVLLFFLFFVLPQFATVLRDLNAKLDPVVLTFLNLSDFLRGHVDGIILTCVLLLLGLGLLLSRPRVRAYVRHTLARLPIVDSILNVHLTALFCRNLGVLLSSGVALTTTLRILVDLMSTHGNEAMWVKVADKVRHGGKLSDALAGTVVLPPMAVRMLRLGEETSQLPALAGRVAEFYEAKLQRSLDRVVGISGPAAIITISIVVGSLIVSVMTALLSVSQVVE
jgi:general secretion pathway protein F